jgi:hypothetical protein
LETFDNPAPSHTTTDNGGEPREKDLPTIMLTKAEFAEVMDYINQTGGECDPVAYAKGLADRRLLNARD